MSPWKSSGTQIHRWSSFTKLSNFVELHGDPMVWWQNQPLWKNPVKSSWDRKVLQDTPQCFTKEVPVSHLGFSRFVDGAALVLRELIQIQHIPHHHKPQAELSQGFWDGLTSSPPAPTSAPLDFSKRRLCPHSFFKDKANIGKRWN